MKKSLFAVAAAGAFAGVAGTAAAQSSVTVYGLLDLGYSGNSVTAANSPAAAGTLPNTVAKTQNNAFNNGAESTNRLGFRGTEDIGGGLSAFFTIEIEIAPNTANSVANAAQGNRQTFVGLKKNGVGQASLGTQYTVLHDAAAVTDPGQLNNMAGNVIYDKMTGGASQTAPTTGSSTYGYSGMQNNTSYTVRSTNMLKVATETIAGFKGNAFYVMNNTNTNSVTAAGGGYTGGTTNNTGWGIGLDYTLKALALTANYQGFSQKNAFAGVNGITTGTPTVGYFGGTTGLGTNVNDVQQYYAGTYDFGILKAYVQYVNRKISSQINSSQYTQRSAQQIGVRSFITPTIEAWASGGNGKLTNAGFGTAGLSGSLTSAIASNSVSGNFSGWQLGSNYWLSKRTNLYAIYGSQSSSNASWSGSTKNTSSYNMSNYAVGVRHTF